MKSTLKTNKFLRFEENLFFNTILGLSPKKAYKPNIENIGQKKIELP